MTDQGQSAEKASNALGILLIVCAALFFGVLNASAVGVVLPEISADLSIGPGQLSWLMTGFLLVYAIAIPIYGRLADLFGARPLFLIGVSIFSVGSLLSALAPNFELLLAARIVQAIGGAAVPGLGMTLASRAYGPEARGRILGVIAATIGLGGAIGPLLGGALAASFGWQSIFVVNAVAAFTIPIAFKILPRNEDRAGGNLDLLGGIALALLVGGALLVASEGARSGWTSPLVLTGVVIAIIGLVVLSARQLTAASPFIPKEFLRSPRYVALVSMSFSVMAANLAPLIGLPILLTTVHRLSPLEVGLVLIPSAILTSVLGLLAGRLTDQKGARLPTWIGSPLMLLAVLGLSTYAGASVWVIAIFSGMLGGGFALVNTPLAATVSRIVRVQMLPSALSINSMMFFLGGSLGTALLLTIVTLRGGSGVTAFNPLHFGGGVGFSDAFLFLALPVVAVMALSLALPRAQTKTASVQVEVPIPPEQLSTPSWIANCSVPWMPACQERSANAGTEVCDTAAIAPKV